MDTESLREYRDSPTTGAALALGLVGIVLAYVSGRFGEWWMAYLQGLSTTVIGLSLGTLILQLLLDLQRVKIGNSLRRVREATFSNDLRHTVQYLSESIPTCDSSALKPIHGHQLKSSIEKLQRLRDSAILLSTEIQRPNYRSQIDTFIASTESVCAIIQSLLHGIEIPTYAAELERNLARARDSVSKFAHEANAIQKEIPDDVVGFPDGKLLAPDSKERS